MDVEDFSAPFRIRHADVISCSNLPGRRNALSMELSAFVVPITTMSFNSERPSISVSSVATTLCSTSPWRAAARGDGVYLVDENDGGGLRLCLLKDLPEVLLARRTSR